MIFSFRKKKKKESTLNTVAFYNLENLFDTHNDNYTLDEDFTPQGAKRWTPKRYKSKLKKIAKTVARLGEGETSSPPVIVGVAEVENKKVVQDLIAIDPLHKIDYGCVHYDSPDERGIDCALIYHRKHFIVEYSEPINLLVYQEDGTLDATRDILYVKGLLNNEPVHIFINHWPSRRDGDVQTEYKRIKAAETLLTFMSKIEETDPDPNYIVMGDFNDDPKSKSIKTLTENKGLYNPMEKLLTPERGSASYKRAWLLFDQIMISHSFLNFEKGTHSFAHANIFDEHFLKEYKGKYKGSPYRTYAGKKYLGGYSDHFPVYVQLRYNS